VGAILTEGRTRLCEAGVAANRAAVRIIDRTTSQLIAKR
jgi:hypothetical protein